MEITYLDKEKAQDETSSKRKAKEGGTALTIEDATAIFTQGLQAVFNNMAAQQGASAEVMAKAMSEVSGSIKTAADVQGSTLKNPVYHDKNIPADKDYLPEPQYFFAYGVGTSVVDTRINGMPYDIPGGEELEFKPFATIPIDKKSKNQRGYIRTCRAEVRSAQVASFLRASDYFGIFYTDRDTRSFSKYDAPVFDVIRDLVTRLAGKSISELRVMADNMGLKQLANMTSNVSDLRHQLIGKMIEEDMGKIRKSLPQQTINSLSEYKNNPEKAFVSPEVATSNLTRVSNPE